MSETTIEPYYRHTKHIAAFNSSPQVAGNRSADMVAAAMVRGAVYASVDNSEALTAMRDNMILRYNLIADLIARGTATDIDKKKANVYAGIISYLRAL